MRPILTAIMFLAIVGAHAEVRVIDDYGRSVALARPAGRVVSLAPHLTELLYAAGAGGRLVGAIEHSDYPEAARGLPRIGSETGINLEALLRLKPDLVAAWPNAGSRRAVDRIAALGVPVYRSEPRELDDVARTLLALGVLTGTRPAAEAAAQAFRERVAALRKMHTAKPVVRVFYEVWNRPLMTVNGAHLISKVMALCGGENVFAALPVIAPPIDREAVLRANPEVIVASGIDGRDPIWLQDWRAFPQLTAVARGNLYAIAPDLMQRHTPRILEGAERLCGALDEARSRR
ncbi:MAG: cobalamin-binding protein [Betaproteobacteria bacterium RIFCSPLOWO2_02_FULL_66_14]|nr:MAG: cobalamin-binding protein [Betaproteobacteria bacterium RIFCSPLOWO2_02_FULL_66_14]